MPNLRVLIVDSNLQSNVLLSKTLSKAGYETRTAFTADEAIARVSQDRFDLILADLGMPNGDSKQLLVRLHQSGASDTVPVLALADGLEDQLAKSALQLGASDILPKPVAADALIARVKRTIERGPRGQVSSRMKKGDRKGDTGGTAMLGFAVGGAAPPAPPPGHDLSGVATQGFDVDEGGAVAASAPHGGASAPAGAAQGSAGVSSGRGDASAHSSLAAAHGGAPGGAPPARTSQGRVGAATPGNVTPGPMQAPKGPPSQRLAVETSAREEETPSRPAQLKAPSGATTEFGPAPARLDAPNAGTPPKGTGTAAPSPVLGSSGRVSASTPPAGTGGAGDRAKTGVSTIQLDARNFVDKHAHQAEARAPSASALAEGDELGLERRAYTIIRELAAGAMGGTYLVKRSGDRGSPYAEELECVLKVSFGDPVADESLRVEQLVLGSIDHPNVVKLLDMGFLPGQDGARFVVLERLYPLPGVYFGRDAERAENRAVDPVTAMRIYLNLVGGLHAIHAKHRLILGDIKPDNIMLRMPPLEADAGAFSREGREGVSSSRTRADYAAKLARGDFEPVFIDFGSALSQEVLHTRKVETFTGSPAYMAPEVLTQGRHSARRDVFALSVTLYEMLTGEKPYGDLGGRPVPELVDAIKRGVPVVDLERLKALRFDEAFAEAAGGDPQAARTQFLRNVGDMIARGADRDPAQRYSTYQLADECRIRFQVRPRQNPPPGARYETPLFQPLDPARIRYTQPLRAPEPAPDAAGARHNKSGRIGKQPPRKTTAPGMPAADPFAMGIGGGTAVPGAIGHSASAYIQGAGILGPPPTASPAPGPLGAAPGTGAGAAPGPSAAMRGIEIELAELRVAYLRSEERAQVAEEAVAERDRAVRKADDRSRQLDELARERDQKRVEASEKAKKALERAAKADEALGALERKVLEIEARASKADAALSVLRSSLEEAEARTARAESAAALYRGAAEESEARADRAEESLRVSGSLADRWREAAALFERGAEAARLAADGARGIADAARRRALAEVNDALGPLADTLDEARKDRPDDDPLRCDAPEAVKLLDALRALRSTSHPRSP